MSIESQNANAENIFRDLVEWWRMHGVRTNPPSPSERIDALERKCQIRLPESFRCYLQTTDGMISGETDEELLRFWSLDEIDQQNGIRHHAHGFDVVFADFSICSHEYILRCVPTHTDDAPVLARDGTDEIKVADSFATFVSKYMVEPKQIAYCWQASKSSEQNGEPVTVHGVGIEVGLCAD